MPIIFPSGGGGGSGAQTVFTQTTSLSSAQILALGGGGGGNQISVASAPGAGKAIVPIGVAARSTVGTTPYTIPGSQPGLAFPVPLAAGSFWLSIDHSLFDSAVNRAAFHSALQDAADFTAVENQPFNIGVDLQLTGGDGTIKLQFMYAVMTL